VKVADVMKPVKAIQFVVVQNLWKNYKTGLRHEMGACFVFWIKIYQYNAY